MEKNNKGLIIILTVISIFALLIAVIGTTFAYFTVMIKGNMSEAKTIIKSVSLGVINFEHGNTIYYDGAIPGRPIWSENEEVKNIIYFSLTSSTSMDKNEKVKYNVYLNITKDTFLTDNVVYLINVKTGVNSGEARMKFGNENDDYKVKFTPYGNGLPLESESFDVGYIPLELANQDEEQKILIGTGEIGGLASRDEWAFEIWVNETGNEQNIDQNKVIEAYISAEVSETTYISNETDKANATT